MKREEPSGISTVFLAFFSVLVLVTAAYGATIQTLYVSPSGNDNPDCGTSITPCKTINYTLANRAGSKAILELAAGTYTENVVIDWDKDAIMINGGGAGVCKITGASTTAPALKVDLAKFSFKGLGLSGGNKGLAINGARGEVQQCNIQKGIEVYTSNVSLRKVTVKNTKANSPGIDVGSNSTVDISSCTLSGSSGPALLIGHNSNLYMENSTVSGNNTGLTWALGAVFLMSNSSASLRDNTISANKAAGISLQSGSTAQLMGGNKVTGNGTAASLESSFRCGISIAFNSHVDLNNYPATVAKDQISGNNGPGIWMMSKGDLMIMGAVIDANNGDGIRLHGNSTANLTSGAVITNNQGYGVACYDSANDSKYMGTPGTITGNTSGAYFCQHY